MRILQICSARDIGGGERHLADLANSLAERGHDVFAAVNIEAAVIDELSSLRPENVFPIRMRGSGDILAAEKIAALIRDKKIDLIHAHVARDYPLAAIASERSGGTPFVLTRHVLFPLKKLHKLLLRRAASVIAVSNAVADSLERSEVFPADSIVTIHNGIDTERFEKLGEKPTVEGLPKIVGMIGHLAPIKGQDIFIHAAAMIARQRDGVNFVIVGEDKSERGENRKELGELISRLGLSDRVSLAGWKDSVHALSDFDIFVSPSRSEPFGLVMLEAMATGVPLIATASEGALEIVEQGVTGMIVSLDDPEQLADAIIQLLDDNDRCGSLSASARQSVRERFSLDKMVDATVSVYRNAIAK